MCVVCTFRSLYSFLCFVGYMFLIWTALHLVSGLSSQPIQPLALLPFGYLLPYSAKIHLLQSQRTNIGTIILYIYLQLLLNVNVGAPREPDAFVNWFYCYISFVNVYRQ